MTETETGQQKITTPKLPAITFINGPQPLATEVANILSDVVPAAMAHSFDEPLRNAANGLFFYGDPSIDIGSMLTKNTPLMHEGDHFTFEAFMMRMHDFLAKYYGIDVLGALAVRAVQDNADYFGYSIFSDASVLLTDDIRRVIKAFDPENCLIVNIDGVPKHSSFAVASMTIHATDAIEIVRSIENALAS